MRNKELIQKRLEQLDNSLTELSRIVNTNESKETFVNQISKCRDIVESLNDLTENQ